MAEPLDEGPPSSIAGQVAEVGAQDRPQGSQDHHHPDVEMPGRCVGGHRQERQQGGGARC